jgi:polar amino acid transport system substrate-binding protein
MRSVAVIAAVGVATTLAITGCSSPASGTAAASSCKPKNAKIQTVTPDTLTVGAIDIPPFSSYNSGNPSGIDVNIVKKYAAEECLKVSWQQATYADAIQSISSGTIDLAIGSIDRTASREKAVDFSSSTYLDGMGIASKSGATTVSDLEKLHTIGTINGYLWVSDLSKILGSRLKTYPSSVELKADFDAGRLDAAVDAYGLEAVSYKDEKGVTIALANAKPDPRVQALVQAPQTAFPLKKDDPSLKDSLSSAIDQMRKDGLIKTWLKDAGLTSALAGSEADLQKAYVVQ